MEYLIRDFAASCLRARHDETALPAIREKANRPDFDWGTVVDFALDEALGPLLFDALSDAGIAPAEVLHALRERYDYTARRNLLLLHELGIVLRALDAAGIATIVLKGAALTEEVYGNIALRPMLDLDLLVRREDVTVVAGILNSLGYDYDPYFNEPGELAFGNELSFIKPGVEDAVLDVHWHLFSWSFYQQRMSIDWFWETALSAGADLPSAFILGPEASVLHLCGHYYEEQHEGPGLLRLYDVGMIIRGNRETIDWELILSKAQDFGLVMAIQVVLPLVQELFESPIPAEVIAQIKSLPVSSEEESAMALITTTDLRGFHRAYSDLSNLPDWRSRTSYFVQFVWGNFFAPPDYMMERYQIRNRALLPLYYLYRVYDNLRAAVKFYSPGKNTG